jgi:hypothetical protein
VRSALRPLLAAGALLLAGAAAASPALAQAAADATGTPAQPAATVPEKAAGPSRLRSAEDGWLDIGGFLDQVYGFVPIAMPITEPAVGYGLGGGVLFVDKPKGEARQAGFGRPNLTAVGALGTENGTRGAAAGDVRHWMNDRLQTIVAAGTASVNLDFFGVGDDAVLSEHPRSYNLKPKFALVQAKYRIGQSRLWAGLGYVRANVGVSFDAPEEAAGLPDTPAEVRVGGLTPLVSYDSRDNIFTPNAGGYFEAAPGFFSPAFGGDSEFRRASLTAMQYLPVRRRLTLGVRGTATLSSGEVPFFLRPYVALRGAPVMRYQGEHAASVELEARWQCWKRFSVVGFAGAGAAWNDFDEGDDARSVVTGGAGFRYEIARAYGLHMGLDVAFGPDATALYVVVGSAWMRP